MDWKKRDNCSSVDEVVFRNICVRDAKDISQWSKKSLAGGYDVQGLDEAVELITSYINKRIRICGDYDVDGRMAAIILFYACRTIGCKHVDVRIPRRFSEGYGMSTKMIDEVEEDDALIITVDNGIAAFEAIEEAKNRGMKVIVTDHHLAQVDADGNKHYPPADIIIDPNAVDDSATYKGYCGAGIAYKLATRLVPSKRVEEALLPYVAIATIADIMELREENYVFTKRGLAMLSRRNGPPGLIALMECMDITTCTASAVGFKLAPALNAPGRMNDHDTMTLQLLASQNMQRARQLAAPVIEQNDRRKLAVSGGMNEATGILEESGYKNGDLIIVPLTGAHHGVLGIIAGHLASTYNVPAIVFSAPDENGIMSGSARSVPGVDIVSVLSKCREMLVSFGGHAQAAGMTVKQSVFKLFAAKASREFKKTGYVFTPPEIAYYDLEIAAAEIFEALDAQEKYEPFGHGNEKPIFKITGYRPTALPKEISGNGVRLRGVDSNAVGFGLWPLMQGMEDRITTLDLYGTLSWNEYMGHKSAQVEILDLKKSNPTRTTDFAMRLKRM